MKNYQEEKEYWYKHLELHSNKDASNEVDEICNYGPDYYVAKILKKILPKLQLPSSG